MRHWTKRLFAIAAPLLLTSCLWGPGKFTSDLTLRKDGSFTLDYRGEIVLQIPEDLAKVQPWRADMAHCYMGAGEADSATTVTVYSKDSSGKIVGQTPKERPCTAAEAGRLKSDYEKREADQAAQKKKQSEQMAAMFGLPGLDDASNRAFAAKLMKYAGWQSVTYRGNGVFDVDYHMQGRATQDFVFPALPDNDLLLPFIAIRRRADGSVLVTAPALTGGAGPLMERMAAAGAAGDTKTSMVSHAQGRFTVVTDGEILTNNSEDGPSSSPIGRQLHWDVGPASNKIPETLIQL
ncbi:MAG: hypothetical protein ACTHJK_13175 [Sphingomicrobium sp.]